MSVRGLKNQKLRSLVVSCSLALGVTAAAMPAAHAENGRLLATGLASEGKSFRTVCLLARALLAGQFRRHERRCNSLRMP